VKDGVIEKMFIEPEVAGDPFEAMQKQCSDILLPEAVKPKVVSFVLQRGCPFCARAKSMLKEYDMIMRKLSG